MLNWIKCSDDLPPMHEEVLVWVDRKRGAAWRNNHAIVAYLASDYNFYEERHNENPLTGVMRWARINIPEV